MAAEGVVEDGLLKSVGGYTWPGIEYGEPPSCRFSFFQYIDALRLGHLRRFMEMEEETSPWWNPHLDRGAGAALHFAVEHGQMRCVSFLLERRGVAVNQQDKTNGKTPLHRCARMAHHTHAPYLAIFEYLLQQGADPSILTCQTAKQAPTLAVDLAVQQGRGWETGRVRQLLQELIDRYSNVPKKPATTYRGGDIGEEAQAIIQAWEALPKRYPPSDWRAPPPAGFADAQSMRPIALDPWKPAGTHDGSCFVRQMTDAELAAHTKTLLKS